MTAPPSDVAAGRPETRHGAVLPAQTVGEERAYRLGRGDEEFSHAGLVGWWRLAVGGWQGTNR
jgi:hypothetical protein